MSSSPKPKSSTLNKGHLEASKLTTLMDPPDDLTHSIPSVSKLLNRRKVMKSLRDEKTKSDLRQPVPAPTVASKPLSIQRTQLKTDRKPLSSWSPDQLKTASDPMGKGLANLFQSPYPQAALFMAIQNTDLGQLFVASAGVQIENGSPFWSGLKWHPQQFAEIWTILATEGFVEFEPGSPNITRVAFDVNPNHWLTLIRVGTPERCRGVLALISTRSIESRLFNELQLFFTNPAPARKAA